MKRDLPIQIKKDHRKSEMDADKGFVEKRNVLDGTYTLVSYYDGHQYVKTTQLEQV